MENRINQLFNYKNKNILSVYFTAGFPNLNDTAKIIEQLEKNGADLIEIGIPFSDPTADGPTIQHSNEVALKNGMSLNLLFKQLKNIREKVKLPLILMGYFNPVMQYGIEKFCEKCCDIGIDGTIIPDLPLEEYEEHYKKYFNKYNLHNILLISPNTSNKRIQKIDSASEGFIYMVSSSSTTGGQNIIDKGDSYFNRINSMNLKNPCLTGFGISDNKSFTSACKYTNGAITGSAFIKKIESSIDLEKDIDIFVKNIKKSVDSEKKLINVL